MLTSFVSIRFSFPVEAEAIRDRSTRTSLQQDDYRHKLAAAFAGSVPVFLV